MNLLINIDEETVHHVRAHGLFLNPRDDKNLVNAIRNGTPVPDNMALLDIRNVRKALSAGVECVEEEAAKIEQIRAEIAAHHMGDSSNVYVKAWNEAIEKDLQVIDKYMKG